MSNNPSYVSYQRVIEIDERYFFDAPPNNFEYSQFLSEVLVCSVEHDQYLKNELGIDLLEDNWSWVVTQNQFEIFDLPCLGQKIVITTELASANRFFVERWFGIYHDQELLMTVYIQFAVIDLHLRKMQTIPAHILKENNLLASDKASKFAKYKADENVLLEPFVRQPILATDMDNNLHVNNLVYIRWILDAIHKHDQNLLANYRVAKWHIKYGSEIREHDYVLIRQFKKEEADPARLMTLHQVLIPSDTSEELTEACHVGIEWVRMSNE